MASTASTLSAPTRDQKTWFAGGMMVVLAIAVAKLLFHLYFNKGYGYFRDEFDYISCANHLAWGYVDQPLLIPFLTRICLAIFGDSLRSVRLLPALTSSVLLVQTALLAREFGGRRFALLLSAVCVLVAPQFLSNGSLLGTNCLEPNLWTGCAYFAVLAIKRNAPRNWLWFGVVAGIGLEEKYSIALFVVGIVVGLLLTEQRRVFLNKWIWLGGVAAFLIFLPNVLWNIHYDWPFLQLMSAIRAAHRDIVLGPLDFFLQQLLIVSPWTAPVWIAGLIALFVSPRLKMYRVLGWSYVFTYTAFFLLHGKNYYLSPIYPILMAAGAVVAETAFERPRLTWLKSASIIALLANGVYLAPIVIPILSPDHFIAYTRTLPFKLPVTEHSHTSAALPQWYSDQFGWQEIVDETAVAWDRLSPAERGDCAIFAQDYGQAGAIDFLGRRYGLPPALSGDRTYYLWGTHGYSGNCMIVLDDSRQKLETLFDQVEFVGTSPNNRYALERNIDVYICRGAKFGTLAELWPKLKKWR